MREYVDSVPDEQAPDVISGGRDPDQGSAVRWRPLAGATAVVLVAAVIAFRLITGDSGHPAPHNTPGSPSSVALAAPTMLHGTPLSSGGGPPAALFLGGQELRVLQIRGQAPAAPTASVLPTAGNSSDPLGPDPAVQQIISAVGGVVALILSHGQAGLPDIGDVVFIPADAPGAGTPRIIARANYLALAPDHRDVWVEQAGPPYGNGPAGSPAWLVGEDGRRLSANRDLGDRALVAATVRGLLVQGPDQQRAFVDPQTGGAEPTGIPENAIIAGADADQVAWQAVACPLRCLLHVTDVRGGPAMEIALPPHTAVGPNDTADFDPAGQHFALPLEITDDQGTITGTSVYVADLGTRKLVRVPGGPVPVASLPAVSGAFPSGTSDVVSARWTADGAGLWIVATDGLYFQVAYWTGHGPLRVLPPEAGLAYKFDVPGTSRPLPADLSAHRAQNSAGKPDLDGSGTGNRSGSKKRATRGAPRVSRMPVTVSAMVGPVRDPAAQSAPRPDLPSCQFADVR
jgi:hypothetical protein